MNTSSFLLLKLVSGTVATVLDVGAAVLSGELPRLRLRAGRRSEIGSHIQRFLDYVTLSLKRITWAISRCHLMIADRQ